MSKFTPGPWEVGTEEIQFYNRSGSMASKHKYYFVYGAKDGLPSKGMKIAILDNLNGSWIKTERIRENAQLISAAPDMYEALKECMVLFALGANAVNKKGINFGEKRDKAREIERKVLNALAKAEGEPND